MKKDIKLISDFNFDLFYNFLKKKINLKNYEIIKPNYELFLNNCYNTIRSNKKNHISDNMVLHSVTNFALQRKQAYDMPHYALARISSLVQGIFGQFFLLQDAMLWVLKQIKIVLI